MKMNRKDINAQLTPEVQEQILQNILKRCGRDGNTIPLEALNSYAEYRQERFVLLRVLTALMLALFLMLPALFLWPELDIAVRTDTAPNRRAYNLTVNCSVPIGTVTAVLNDKTVPVYEAAGTQYLVMPAENGLMNIEVVLKNGQRAQASIEVTGIDTKAPDAVRTEFDDTYMYIYLQDPSGIDVHDIRVTDMRENVLSNWRYDHAQECIVLDYPDTDMLLAIPDIYGNTLTMQINAPQ